LFLVAAHSPAQKGDAVTAVTGWQSSLRELMRVAEQALALTHILNLRKGFTSADERLSERFATPQTTGGLAGVIVDPEALSRAQQLYYGKLGLGRDEEGVPTEARSVELDIEWTREYRKHL